MSIRNKLVISNMLMIIIPVIIIVITLSITSAVITYFSTSDTEYDPTFGSFLLYNTQFEVSELEDAMKNTDASDFISKMDSMKVEPLREGITESKSGLERYISDNVLITCANIEDNGSNILIIADDEIVYKTVGADVYSMLDRTFDICGKSLSDIKESFVTSGANGTVITNVFEIENEGTVKTVAVNENLRSVVGSKIVLNGYLLLLKGGNVITVAIIIAVIAIIVTNSILIIFMLRTIVKPMQILSEATHELRDGNLDYRIPYSSKNEIGQVCADFDEMRRRLKESAEQQKKYEENRTQLVAGISHDLGTPLTTIKGYASGILDGIADTDEKKMRYARVIYDTAEDMDTLVSELSTFSKLSLDKVPFYFEKINAKEFFDEYADYISQTLSEVPTNFSYSFECDENRVINVDPSQLKRVLRNLVDNSRKYASPDRYGEIRLTVSDAQDGKTRICVEDNGLGVSESEREKIFETFYRSDKARTGAKKGSGLGLSITKQITDRHGASIKADESELGGLAVIIELPKA